MKIRKGFVTNSSSSSFIISKKNISKDKKVKIYNHLKYAEKELGWNLDELDFPWEITEDKDYIYGWVSMNNFEMKEFLKQIGVSENIIEFEEKGFIDFDKQGRGE